MHIFLLLCLVGIVTSFFIPRAERTLYLPLLMSTSSHQHLIEVYSRVGCKYCRKAKSKLREAGITEYVAVDIEVAPEDVSYSSQTMDRITHAKSNTVPQIYISDRIVGGCDDLLKEIEDGIFDSSLEKYNILRSKKDEGKDSDNTESDGGAGGKKMKVTTINWVGQNENKQLILNTPLSMTSSEAEALKENTLPELLSVSRLLQRRALMLMDMFSDDDTNLIDYSSMLESAEFKQYVTLAAILQEYTIQDFQALSDMNRKVGWLSQSVPMVLC